MKKLNKLTAEELSAISERKADNYFLAQTFFLIMTGFFATVTASLVWFKMYKAVPLHAADAPIEFQTFIIWLVAIGAFVAGMAATILSIPTGRADEGSTPKATLSFSVFLAMLVDGGFQALAIVTFSTWMNITAPAWVIIVMITGFQLLTFFARSGMAAATRYEQELIDAAAERAEQLRIKAERQRIEAEVKAEEDRKARERGRRRAKAGKMPAELNPAYMDGYNDVKQAEQMYASQTTH